MTTIFAQIIERTVPADIIYEDDIVIAFLDINPIQPGHALVIPKIPSIDGLDCSSDTLAHLIKVGQKIAQTQKKVLSCDGVNFIMNNGAAAGQEVFHTHLHVIPRFTDDDSFEEPLRGEYEEDEATDLATALAKALV
jgi:histidine triad (HIT) family protein